MNQHQIKTGRKVVSVAVHARQPANPTGVTLIAGHRYRVNCDPRTQWQDGRFMCNADGWRSSRAHGSIRWLVKWAERWRLLKETDWFTLIGIYASHPQHAFAVGVHHEFVARFTDALLLTANDLPWMYWNNRGELAVRIQDLGPELHSPPVVNQEVRDSVK